MLFYWYTLMEKQKKEFIAYKGPYFTIEWYCNEQGDSDVLNYVNNLSPERQRKILVLLRRMGDIGEIFDKTKFRYEGDKVYAFKPQPDRFLCFFFSGKKIIITNAFEKKTDKLPQNEKQKALTRRADYEQRVSKGIYYENI